MNLVETIAGRIERDRNRIEPRAVRNLSGYGKRAMMHAVHAIRLGHDPAQAASDVLRGNDRLDQPGIGEYLTSTLVMADLLGRRRTRLNAQAHAKDKGIRFSREEDEKRKKELAVLLLLLLLTDDEKAALFARYRIVAGRIVDGLVNPLAEDLHALRAARVAGRSALDAFPKTMAVQLANIAPFKVAKSVGGTAPPVTPITLRESIVEAKALTGPTSLRAFETAVKVIFRSNGIVPQHESRLQAWISTSVTQAYERGRFTEQKRPEIKEMLWGYHYTAILDTRTTELCRKLDGMTAPIDDPAWIRWTPPNHFGCRSHLVEVWESSALARRPEIIEPKATVDDLMRFMEIKRKFLSYL